MTGVRPPIPPRHECRDCQAPIVFALLDSGNPIPLDPMPHTRGNVAVIKIGHRLHGHIIKPEKPVLHGWSVMMPHAATCAERPGPAKAKPDPDLPLF